MSEQKWKLTDEEYDRLNPGYQIIDAEEPDLDKFLHVGYIATPRNKAEWFIYHFVHGLWMRYPFWKVVLYCFDKDNYFNE